MERTCGVKLFGRRIKVFDETRILPAVRGPFLVQWRPCDDGRMVAVTSDNLSPFGQEVASRFHLVAVHTPAWCLTPGEISQAVGPIVEALLKYLLVKSGTIEACLHRQFNISTECFVGRCCPDAVGIEALVEHQSLIERLIVQIDSISLDMHFAHADVAFHAVHGLSVAVGHSKFDVIEEWTGWAPSLHLTQRKYHYAIVAGFYALLRHNAVAVFHLHLKHSSALGEEVRMHNDLLLVDVGQHLHIRQSLSRHGFHPYRLPDARSTRIVATV